MSTPTAAGTGLPLAAPHDVGLDAQRLTHVGTLFAESVASQKIPGAVVAIARDGRIGYLETFGVRDRERGDAMTADTLFRIASMTKPIVGVAALQLVEEGRLQLNTPVGDVLPEIGQMKVGVEVYDVGLGTPRLRLEEPQRAMTVQDLFRHTSGLIYGAFGDTLVHRAHRKADPLDRAGTTQQALEKLADLPLMYHPGTTHEYGISTDVLGMVVERLRGKTLDVVLRERIFAPLGMDDTGFVLRDADRARLANPPVDPHSGKRQEIPGLDPYSEQTTFFSGGGGLLSTVADYLRFGEMLRRRGELDGVRILSRKAVELMTSDHLPPNVASGPTMRTMVDPAMGLGFGLCVAVRTSVGRATNLGSAGDFAWGGVYGTYWFCDPSEALTVVMMMQAPLERRRVRNVLRDVVTQALR